MNDKSSQFESLHKSFAPMVMQLCVGFMKGDRDHAKDLTQEIFINIWNALGKFQGASSYKTWIYRITVNTCLKFIRDSRNNATVDIEEANPASPHPADEQHEILYRAIGRLPQIDRLIIMMVLEGLEYEEISNVIGVNIGNLRVRIHRIKKNLKSTLEHEQ